MEPRCQQCGSDHDLVVLVENDTRESFVVCNWHYQHLIGAWPAGTFHYQGTYLEYIESVTANYLGQSINARRAAASMTTAHTVNDEGPTSAELHNRAADTLEFDTLFDMPSDAVLDAYIDSNPDKFTYVASADNTDEVLAMGLAEWARQRESYVE